MSKIYIIDIDGTIFEGVTPGDYTNSKPLYDRIDKLNKLYDEGNTVIYWTARGQQSGKNWEDFTKEQLDAAGVKYTEVRFNKPHYDVWIDDKAINDTAYFM